MDEEEGAHDNDGEEGAHGNDVEAGAEEEEIIFEAEEESAPLFPNNIADLPESTETFSDTSSMGYEKSTDLILAQVTQEYKSQQRYSLYNRSWWNKWTLPGFLRAAYNLSGWTGMHPRTGDLHHCVNTLLAHNDCIQMTQMTAKAGIKKHGDRAVAALIKELSQNLHEKDAIEGKQFSELSSEQRRDALRAIPLIKEKRNGTLKGRVCADGRPQRKWVSSEDSYSPTVSSESTMLSLAQDAHEKRFVAICDIEGAYLHAKMDDFVLMVFEDFLVDLLIEACPQYKEFVHVTRNGKKLLYVRLKRALYGCIKSALLWWHTLTGTLFEEGFELNPYDSCVANKTLPDGSQLTVCFYVDDLKCSSTNKEEVMKLINTLETRYGVMKKSLGKKHTYLGMDVEFCEDGTVKILMKDHLMEAIQAFAEDLGVIPTTPAAASCFEVDPESPSLPEAKRRTFHSIVQKLLYVSKRARPDLQPTIAFLTKRVSKATE